MQSFQCSEIRAEIEMKGLAVDNEGGHGFDTSFLSFSQAVLGASEVDDLKINP